MLSVYVNGHIGATRDDAMETTSSATTIATAAATRATRLDWNYLLHSCICLFFMFGFGQLPPIPPLHTLGMEVLGIFIGLLYAWITIGFVWPSFVSLIALRLTGLESMNEIIASGFGNNITVFIFLMFVLVIFFEKSGICERIAYWFLSRKIVIGRPWTLVTLFFLAPYFMAMLTYSYPAMLISWTILYTVCKDLGYKKGDLFPSFMVLGVGLAAQLGLTTLPIKSHSLLSIGILDSITNGKYIVNFFDYATINITITLSTLFIFILMMRFVFKVDVEPLRKITEEQFDAYRDHKMTIQEKLAVCTIVSFIGIMALPSILPHDWQISILLRKFGMAGSLIIVFAMLTMLRISGKPILNFAEVANNGKLGWEVIIMYVGCMPVSAAMAKPEVGITSIIVEYCTPLLSHLSSFQFLIITFIVITLLTQVMHNLVLAAILTPILVQLSLAAGCDPSLLIIILCFAYGFSTTTPASSASSALVFLNEWSTTKLNYKVFISHFVISMIVVSAVFVPLAYMYYNM